MVANIKYYPGAKRQMLDGREADAISDGHLGFQKVEPVLHRHEPAALRSVLYALPLGVVMWIAIAGYVYELTGR